MLIEPIFYLFLSYTMCFPSVQYDDNKSYVDATKIDKNLIQINTKNPRSARPNRSLPMVRENATKDSVRYDANHRKLIRGPTRLSTNRLTPFDFSNVFMMRGASNT